MSPIPIDLEAGGQFFSQFVTEQTQQLVNQHSGVGVDTEQRLCRFAAAFARGPVTPFACKARLFWYLLSHLKTPKLIVRSCFRSALSSSSSASYRNPNAHSRENFLTVTRRCSVGPPHLLFFLNTFLVFCFTGGCIF